MTTVTYETAGRSTSASVVDWAKEVPYFFGDLFFPPFNLAKTFARKGSVDHGMSGYVKWEPFELTPNDYEQIRQSYRDSRASGLQFVEPERPINGEIEWDVWKYARAFGVPEDEHRALLNEVALAKADLDGRVQTRSESEIDRAHRHYVEVGGRYATFIQRYVNGSRRSDT